MNEMVERVARAICRAAWSTPRYGDDGLEEFIDRHWDMYAGDARAAIAAMREPTEGMVDAGLDVGPDRDPVTYYRVMIDAALSDA